MPVNRTHAFASGPAYPPPGMIERLRRPSVSAAWRSFREGATLGPACMLGPNAWCANDGDASAVIIGARVICRGVLRRETFGAGRMTIGDDVYIGDDCIISCADAIEIGAGTLIGHGVQIFDNNSHPVDPDRRASDWEAVRTGGVRDDIATAPIRIGERAWIGFATLILRGVELGEECVVGAGSVVTRDVDKGATVAGNPARPIR